MEHERVTRLLAAPRARRLPAGGFRIPVIALKVRGEVEVIDAETFAVIAKTAKETCPIAKALGGVGEITLDVALES